MKGIVITPANKYCVMDLDEPIYRTAGEVVGGKGGSIEIVRPRNLEDPFVLLVDEDGLLKSGWQDGLNLVGCFLYETLQHGNPIVGTIIMMAEYVITEGDDAGAYALRGLTDEELEYMVDKLVDFFPMLEEVEPDEL